MECFVSIYYSANCHFVRFANAFPGPFLGPGRHNGDDPIKTDWQHFRLSFLVEWSLLLWVSLYVCVFARISVGFLLKFPCFSSQYSIICVNIILSRSTLPRPHPRSSLRVYCLLLVCYPPRPLPTRQHTLQTTKSISNCVHYTLCWRESRDSGFCASAQLNHRKDFSLKSGCSCCVCVCVFASFNH